MARIFISLASALALSGCAGVTLSNVDDGHSLEYRTALPAIMVSLDAACKATSQVVSLPGPPRYMAFRSGLGKADTAVDFGPGGIITKFNSKTEGQVADALSIASALMKAGGIAALDGGGSGTAPTTCKPSVMTYLIEYDAAGRPTVDMSRPVFLQMYGTQ